MREHKDLRLTLQALLLALVLPLASCGSDEPETELQVFSTCHFPMMAEVASPILNWPQVAGAQRSCSLVVRNVGAHTSKGTTFRFIDSAQIRFNQLQGCSAAEIVPCPAVSGGAGSLPDIAPGGQFQLSALLDTTAPFNGIASASFEVRASNEVSNAARSVRIDADLRSADLQWRSVSTSLAAGTGAGPVLQVQAELFNAGAGSLQVAVPSIESPAEATVQSASYTSADGTLVVPANLGRYPNWDGLPPGSSVLVNMTVQLPPSLHGTQTLRLRTPESGDPVTANNTIEGSFTLP